MKFTIVRGAPGHLPALGAIERAAAALFGNRVPASVVADATPAEELRDAQEAGLLWVALVDGRPVGFALADDLEASLHLEEMDVDPGHGRRGIGTALVEAVCTEATRRGYAAVTLTTYREFAWNLPFYARLGFTEVPPGELPEELHEILREEAGRGLDPQKRAVMRRVVGPAQKR